MSSVFPSWPYGLGNNEITINQEKYHRSRAIHFKDPWALVARKMIFDSLFQNPPVFYRNGIKMELQEEFERVVQNEWVGFSKDSIDEYYTRGIIPIIIKETENGIMYPAVVKDIHYITQKYNRKLEKYVYKLYRIKGKDGNMFHEGKWDKKVQILSGFGYDPLPDGDIISPVSVLLSEQTFISSIRDMNLSQEIRRTNPVLLIETDKEQLDKGEIYASYADGDRAQALEEDRFIMNKAEVKSVKEQERIFKEGIKQDFPNTAEHMNLFQPFQPLPYGYKASRNANPPPRTDFLELNKAYQETVCSVYGVPKSMIGESNRSNGLSQGMKNNRDSFFQTTSYLKKILSSILERVYNCIFSEEECQFLTDDIVSSGRKYNKSEIWKIAEENRVRIEFPILPLDDHNGLFTKYIIGTIDWETYEDTTNKISGISDHGKKRNNSKGLSDREKNTIAYAMKESILKDTPFKLPNQPKEPKTKKQKTDS